MAIITEQLKLPLSAFYTILADEDYTTLYELPFYGNLVADTGSDIKLVDRQTEYVPSTTYRQSSLIGNVSSLLMFDCSALRTAYAEEKIVSASSFDSVELYIPIDGENYSNTYAMFMDPNFIGCTTHYKLYGTLEGWIYEPFSQPNRSQLTGDGPQMLVIDLLAMARNYDMPVNNVATDLLYMSAGAYGQEGQLEGRNDILVGFGRYAGGPVVYADAIDPYKYCYVVATISYDDYDLPCEESSTAALPIISIVSSNTNKGVVRGNREQALDVGETGTPLIAFPLVGCYECIGWYDENDNLLGEGAEYTPVGTGKSQRITVKFAREVS